jgi:hypothetical protein
MWFKRLKKWQKGAIKGCAVGVLFAILLTISLIKALDSTFTYEAGMWITKLHMWLYQLSEVIIPFRPFKWVKYGLAGIIIVFYGGFGALAGRTQQVNNPSKKWLLTGLLAILLILFYCASIYLAWWWGHA